MSKLPPSAQNIITQLNNAGFEAYAVGGSVRDLLMKKPTSGWDFTTNATPSEIMEVFPDSFYDNKFGTVGVKIGPTTNDQRPTTLIDIYEITTYRSEWGYGDRRRPDKVIWGDKLEEDLSRRDFTVNAIAFDGESFVDPFNGQKDIKEKKVRAVGNPEIRFNEDALRLIRAIRIATQLSFTIENDTFTAIKNNARLINDISADRIRNELLKIMECDYPADGILLLKNANLLQEILPELEKCFGVAQKSPKRHHIYDVGTHLVKSLENCPSKDPIVRFATLIHDIGKPVVFRKNPKTELITFYNHEVVGASIARNITRRLNFSRADRNKIITLVRWHQFTVDERQTDAALRRFIRRVTKEYLKDMLDLRIGDRLGGGARVSSWRLRLFTKRLDEVQKQPFTPADLKVSGYDVMEIFNIKTGPMVGKILNQLFDEVVADKLKNEKEALLKRLEEIKEKP